MSKVRVLLGLLTVVGSFGFLRSFVSANRAGVVALILATSPLYMLSSINLAGAIPLIATSTLSLGFFAQALCRKGSRLWMIPAGIFAGFSVWSGGLNGLLIVLGSVGTYGLWSVSTSETKLFRPLPILALLVAFAATFGVGLANTISLGLELTADQGLGGLSLVWAVLADGFEEGKDIAGLSFALGAVLMATVAGFFSERFRRMGLSGFLLMVGGIAVVTIPPLIVLFSEVELTEMVQFLLYNEFLSRRTLSDHVTFAHLFRQVGFAAYPYTMFLPLGIAYLVHTIQPAAGDVAANASLDKRWSDTGAFKSLLICWFAVAFLVVGVTATLSRHYIFVGLFPIAAAVGLLLTDRGYWEGLRKNRTVYYLVGFASLAVLLVLTKDLKTKANVELGQLGPEVLFEFLVVDGREDFPETYALHHVAIFRYIWMVLLALYFWMLLSWMIGKPDRIRARSERFSAEFPGKYRWRKVAGLFVVACGVLLLGASVLAILLLQPVEDEHGSLLGSTAAIPVIAAVIAAGVAFVGVFGFFFPGVLKAPSKRGQVATNIRAVYVGLGEVLHPVYRLLAVFLRLGRPIFESPRRFVAVFMVSTIAFAGLTATAFMPELANHLSPRGLIDSYRTYAREGEVFYRVGTTRASANYYLGEDTVTLSSGFENPSDTIRGVSDLRPFFCDPSERMFAMLDRDSLAQAYYEVRHSPNDESRSRGGGDDDDDDDDDDDEAREGADDEACDPDRNLWVLDARSSRYVLVSNQLNTERADVEEADSNPIAEHVFAELPADAIAMRTEYTFDGDLRLVGYRVVDQEENAISTVASGDQVYLDTFFQVIERVPSQRKMFIHVDYRNQRINGDHDPVGGEFPINYWVPGEIVRDRFELTIDRGSASGDYSINIGFFSGDSRMEVSPHSGDNRVQLGMIHVTGGI